MEVADATHISLRMIKGMRRRLGRRRTVTTCPQDVMEVPQIRIVLKTIITATNDVNLHNFNNIEDEEEDKFLEKKRDEGEVWLRRNYYFVVERRWAPYGALEVIGGTLINMLEGIPLTTTSRTLCIARPVCVMLISTFLLVLLVWKVPNAVRVQQWCTLFVMSGTILMTGFAVGNAVSPAATMELTAACVGLVVVAISMLLSTLDMMVMLATYVPILRKILSLRAVGLQSTVNRSSNIKSNHLLVPMLTVMGGGSALAAAPGAAGAMSSNPPNTAVGVQQPRHTTANHSDCTPPLATTPPPQPQPDEDSDVETPPSELEQGEQEILDQILLDLEAFERKRKVAEREADGTDLLLEL
jgi:hypothetical protein